jgi:hypothetical protein
LNRATLLSAAEPRRSVLLKWYVPINRKSFWLTRVGSSMVVPASARNESLPVNGLKMLFF